MTKVKIRDIIILIIILSIFTIINCEPYKINNRSYLWLICDKKPIGYIEYITDDNKIISNIFLIKQDIDGISSIHIQEEIEFKDGIPLNITISNLSSDMKTIVEKTKSGYLIKTNDADGHKQMIFTTKPTIIIDPAFILPKNISVNTGGNFCQYQILNFNTNKPTLDYGSVSTKIGERREIIVEYKGNTERFIYDRDGSILEEGNIGILRLIRRPIKPEEITPLKFQLLHTSSSDVFNSDFEIEISGANIDINLLNEAPQTFKGIATDYTIMGSFNTNQIPDIYNDFEYKRATGLITSFNSQLIISSNELSWGVVKNTGIISYLSLLDKDLEILKKNGFDARLVSGLVYNEMMACLVPHRWLEVYIADVGFLPIDPHPLLNNETRRIRLIVGNDARYSDITYINRVKPSFKPIIDLPINKTLEYKLAFEKAEVGTVSGIISGYGDAVSITFKTDTLWSKGEGTVRFKRGYGTVDYSFNSLNIERPITERTSNISSDDDVFIISPVNPLLMYQLTSAITGDETSVRVRNAVSENIFEMSIIFRGTDTIYIQGVKVDVSIYSIPQIDTDIYVDRAGMVVLIESPLCGAELTTPLQKRLVTEIPPVEEREEEEIKPQETIENNVNEVEVQ